MKSFIISFLCLSIPSLLWATPASLALSGTGSFVSDAPLEKIEGTTTASGNIQIDFADLTNVVGEIKIPVNSMRTGNTKRDEHMNSAEWLDEKKCSEISFKTKSIAVSNQQAKKEVHLAKLNVTGSFTLHCVTKELTIPVTLKWKGNKVKVDTSFTITLADYNVAGSKGIVGNKVGKTIDVKVSIKGQAK